MAHYSSGFPHYVSGVPKMINEQWVLLIIIVQKNFLLLLFFLSTLGPMHRFEKKMDDAQTQKLGCVMHTLGV